MEVPKGQVLTEEQLNIFSTSYCDARTNHDHKQCLFWHPRVSPHLSSEEVELQHLRRAPIRYTQMGKEIVYGDTSCQFEGRKNCPRGDECEHFHNEKEFMYHPFVYMTKECRHPLSTCPNRTCAFFHNKEQQDLAEVYRRQLIRDLQATQNRKEESNREPIQVDLSSSNEFPSLGGKETLSYVSTPVAWSDANHHRIASMNSTKAPTAVAPSAAPSSGSINGASFDTYGTLTDSLSLSVGRSMQMPMATTVGAIPPETGLFGHTTESPFTHRGPQIGMGGSGSLFANPWDSLEAEPSRRFFAHVAEFESLTESLEIVRTDYTTTDCGRRYRGQYRDNGILRAVRVLEVDVLPAFLPQWTESAKICQALTHSGLARVVLMQGLRGEVYLVSDSHSLSLQRYCESNQKALVDQNRQPTPMFHSITRQLLQVLCYLQKHDVVHCNFKWDNIFIETVEEGLRVTVGETESYMSPMSRLGPGSWSSPKNNLRDLGSVLRSLLPVNASHGSVSTPTRYWEYFIRFLLQVEPTLSIDPLQVYSHPLFWMNEWSRCYTFLSNSITGCRLLDSLCDRLPIQEWVGTDSWKSSLPHELSYVVRDYAKYRGDRVGDLLRVIILTIQQIASSTSNPHLESLRKAFPGLKLVQFLLQAFPNLIPTLWEMLFTHYLGHNSRVAALQATIFA